MTHTPFHPFSIRTALLLAAGTVAIGLTLAGARVALAPDTSSTHTLDSDLAAVSGQPVGVGNLLEGPRPDANTILVTAARMRAEAALPGAPETLLALATDLAMGAPIAHARWEGIDPNLFGFVFHPPQSTSPHAGGSLAREAVMLGRVDALAEMAEAGMPTTADGGVIFWGALELWSDRHAADARRVLAVAATEPEGVDRAHEEGFTAFEMAATVSLDAMVGLIEAGGNPWLHPADRDGSIGLPSVMERLALHAAADGSLAILDGILDMDGLAAPTERVRFNTVGNLADSALALSRAGAVDQATKAAAVGKRIEARYGAVPAHFWHTDIAALAPNTQGPTKAAASTLAAPMAAPVATPDTPTPPRTTGSPRPSLAID